MCAGTRQAFSSARSISLGATFRRLRQAVSWRVPGIIDAVSLYTVAVDSQTWELFDQAFATDVRVDFGGPTQWHDLASFKRDFAAVHAPFKATQQSTSNHRVLVDGDRGYCLSCVRAMFIRDVSEGGHLFEAARHLPGTKGFSPDCHPL